MKDREKVQCTATIRILNYWSTIYKTSRLETLKISPLSMYLELHDVLFLLSFLKENFDIDLPIRVNSEEKCCDKNEARGFYRSTKNTHEKG